MSQSPQTVSPDIVAKLVADLDAQRQAVSTERRWYACSWIARMFILLQSLQVVSSLVALVVGASPPESEPWLWIMALTNVLLSGLSILVGVWAYRYCVARSDRRLT